MGQKVFKDEGEWDRHRSGGLMRCCLLVLRCVVLLARLSDCFESIALLGIGSEGLRVNE